MDALLIGYARVSTDEQDLTAQRMRSLLLACRLYVDHGLTGTNRESPGLREALRRAGFRDTLVVTKLDRLARSLPDARAMLRTSLAGHVKPSLGRAVHDPTHPIGRLLFNVQFVVARHRHRFLGYVRGLHTRHGRLSELAPFDEVGEEPG